MQLYFHNITNFDHMFFSGLILMFLFLQWIVILSLNMYFLSCNLIIRKITTRVYRSFIYLLLVVMLISIFILRIYNRNKIILFDINIRLPSWDELKLTFKLIPKALEYLEVYGEITILHIIIIFFCILLTILLWFILFLTFIIYIKSRAYSAHIYFLKFKVYEEPFSFIVLYLNYHLTKPIDAFVGNNYANKNNFIRNLANFIHARDVWLRYIISSLIYFGPFILLFSDIYLYNGIVNFFYYLPWIYLLVLCRILNTMGKSTYGTRSYGSDSDLCNIFYHSDEYTKFIVSCLKLTPIKIKRRKVR